MFAASFPAVEKRFCVLLEAKVRQMLALPGDRLLKKYFTKTSESYDSDFSARSSKQNFMT